MVEPKNDTSFHQFWEDKMGVKSRKSLRYDQRALARRGNVTFEILDDFETVRTGMPATCLIEVESRKALENIGLYTIRGNGVSFLNFFPNWQNSPGYG